MTQVKAEKSKLRLLRERYNLSQEQLARMADITLNTYRNAERGDNVEYTTARKILYALHDVQSSEEHPLALDDLGVSIV